MYMMSETVLPEHTGYFIFNNKSNDYAPSAPYMGKHKTMMFNPAHAKTT